MPHKDPEARRAYRKAYRERNQERLKQADADRYRLHADEVKERSRQRYEANCEAEREKRRDYYRRNRERMAEAQRRYNEANRDQIQRVRLDYYQRNAARESARAAEWNRERPERRNAIGRRRAAQKRGATDLSLTSADWRAIKEAFGHRCAYCGRRPSRLTQDHVVPLSKGGQHTRDNVVPACHACNCRKGAGPAPAFVVTPEGL